jgi:hypothetical protein
VLIVAVGAGQRKALIATAPRFDMRQEMELRLLSHPRRLAERCDQLARARY